MISFIVPAYNEAGLLGATLEALHATGLAQGEPYEVVVADDASTDGTAMLAQQHGARVVTVSHRQIAATRNSGARASQGDVLIFVDADTLVNGAVVRAALHALRHGAVGGGAGVRFDGKVPWPAEAFLWLLVRVFRATRLAAGCFVFCTRSAFSATGGFDETYFGAEELVLSQALKRHGRFVVLRESVTTSARKLRTHSLGETTMMLARLALRGRKAIRQREGMEFWYDGRRDESPQPACKEPR